MKVIVLTENHFKYQEIKKFLEPFGFITVQEKKCLQNNMNTIFDKYQNDKIFVLSEITHLEDFNGNIIKNPEHLSQLKHVSTLNVDYLSNNKITHYVYTDFISGFIDINQKQNNPNIYNWDDIFICDNTFKSYQTMKEYNDKFSARTKVLSHFIKEHGQFSKAKDLNFNPFKQNQVVEFSDKLYYFVNNNEYLKKYKDNTILKNLMSNVLNNGVFTRSSINKKQRNYWYPSLNAGLPLVAKKDEIHETTFMFHDLMHHLLPDCILTGNTSENHKTTYMIHRMLSEAFTLVMADMVFVNELAKNYPEYDWNKRKIYPVFKSLNITKINKKNLKEIIFANVNFALLGDLTYFKNLKPCEKSLNEYVSKYEKFFIEDYRWTAHNYDNMINKNIKIKSWYQDYKDLDLIKYENTLDYFEEKTRNTKLYKDKVNIIFELLWNKISNYIEKESVVDIEKSNSKAFKNYIIGQSFIFYNYPEENINNSIKNIIFNELKNKETYTEKDIFNIRSLYNKYIDYLTKNELISNSDSDIYKEVYPFFDAFYVNYDIELKFKNINEVLNNFILNK